MVYTALNAPDIFSSIGKVFKGGGKGGGKSGGGKGGKGGGGGGGGDLKGLAILLLLALALLALCAGVVTTILIVMQADREHVGEIYDLYKPA